MKDRPPASPQSEALIDSLMEDADCYAQEAAECHSRLGASMNRQALLENLRDALQVAGAPVSPTLTNAEKAAHWKKWCDELEGAPVSQADDELQIIGYTHAYDLDFPFAYASLGPENSERNIPVYVKRRES